MHAWGLGTGGACLCNSRALHPEVGFADVDDGADLGLEGAVHDLHHALRRDALPAAVGCGDALAALHGPLDVHLLHAPQVLRVACTPMVYR